MDWKLFLNKYGLITGITATIVAVAIPAATLKPRSNPSNPSGSILAQDMQQNGFIQNTLPIPQYNPLSSLGGFSGAFPGMPQMGNDLQNALGGQGGGDAFSGLLRMACSVSIFQSFRNQIPVTVKNLPSSKDFFSQNSGTSTTTTLDKICPMINNPAANPTHTGQINFQY